MKHIVMGTAGHIDHGKTEMIRALTGIDTDRLKEEKDRGISIDLGFAYFTLKDGVRIGVVDVPGHEKFVKNMLAGVGGIDFVLFVVAADEGVMPQTVEHLDILHFLGVTRGILVLTKIGMVDEEWLELVEEDLRNHVRGTFLEDAPLVRIDSLEKRGIRELCGVIEELVSTVESRSTFGPFRYPIDRIFTVQGFGTVVTGTIWSGSIAVGDCIVVLPGGRSTRIRNIQVHNEQVGEAFAGQRAALALHNVEKSELARGYILAAAGNFEPSYMLDGRLILSRNAGKPLKDHTRIRFYHGTSEILGRIVLLDAEQIDPGMDALVQFRLESPIVARQHDRFVIRSYSPMRTIGGGIVIEPAPGKHKRFRKDVIERLVVAEKGSPTEVVQGIVLDTRFRGISKSEILRRTGKKEEELRPLLEELTSEGRLRVFPGNLYLHGETYERVTREITGILTDFHRRNPRRMGIPKEELKSRITANKGLTVFDRIIEQMTEHGSINVRASKVALREFFLKLAPAEAELKEQIEAVFLEEAFTPPTLAELKESHFPGVKENLLSDLFYLLLETGVLEKVSNAIVFHRANIEKAEEMLLGELKKSGEIGVGNCKKILCTTRKYIIPLLEYFDRKGLTRRKGDVRILM